MLGVSLSKHVVARGGLADTVFDRDHTERPEAERNGFVFEHSENLALESALDRAIDLYLDEPDAFRELAVRGMGSDYSWNRPGQDYLNIYEMIRHK